MNDKNSCIWPDCGHDTNQSDPTPGCKGKFCPKPEAQAAGGAADKPLCDPVLEDRIIEVVREYGSYRAAAKALGIDYVHLHRLKHGARLNPSDAALEKLGLVMSTTRTIRRKNALPTPASHDAQQPEAAGALAGEGDGLPPMPTMPWLGFDPERGDLHGFSWGDMRAYARAAIAATPAPAQQPAVVGDDGFRRAFYEIADVLEIGARPYSPEIAFQRDMLPRIRELAELAKGQEYQHSVAGDEVVWRVARALWASRRNTLVGVGQDPERAWNKHKACLYIDAQHAIAALTPAATPGERTCWDDLRDYGCAFARDGKRIDPADVFLGPDRSVHVAQKEGNGNG